MAGVNPYVGPDSDEHTFVKHMEGVIPLSALFLLVINDSVPVDSYGALDQVRGKYIHAEIASFLRMVERGERSIKDFAVYYCGNTRLDLEARKAFVQALLNEFPCIVKILEGNHFLFVNNQNVASWVKARLGLGKDGPFFSEETGGEKARCQAEELYRKSLGEPISSSLGALAYILIATTIAILPLPLYRDELTGPSAMAALDCAILVFALSAIFLVIDLAVLLIAARRRKEAFNTFAALSSPEKGSRQISSSKLGGTALALNLILAISHVSIILLGIVYLFAESPNSFFLPLLGFFLESSSFPSALLPFRFPSFSLAVGRAKRRSPYLGSSLDSIGYPPRGRHQGREPNRAFLAP